MIFKVHHLNCATFCPVGGRFVNRSPAKMVCHCLLIESDRGLILVDTALGLRDVMEPRKHLNPAFRLLVKPILDPRETAVRQVEKLGFSKSDVRHIVLTHLDLDHAGGIVDFPWAQVHVFDPEYQAAIHPKTMIEKLRYHSSQWDHQPQWVLHERKGESWYGFESVRELEGLPPEVLLIPLIGHTRGHCGVAVDSPSGWLLHAGDAYFYEKEMDPVYPHGTPGLNFFQRIVEIDRTSRFHNLSRLRELVRSSGAQVQVFCAHDPAEMERFQGIDGLSIREVVTSFSTRQ